MAARAGRGLRLRSRKFYESLAQELIAYAGACAGPLKPGEIRDPPPEPLAYIWGWYRALADARSCGPFGLNPISFSEIAAYAALMRISPAPWEVRLLRLLDDRQLETVAAQQPKTKTPEAPAPVAIDDVKGVSALLTGLRHRADAAFQNRLT